MDNPAERRNYRRMDLSMPLRVRIREEGHDHRLYDGEAQDISVRGMGLKLAESNGFAVGGGLEMDIYHILGEPPIRAFGSVRWIKKTPESNWPLFLGIQLTGISDRRSYERWAEVLSWSQTLCAQIPATA